MRRLHTPALALYLSLCLGGTALLAQPGSRPGGGPPDDGMGPPDGMGGPPRLERLARDLNLSAEQQTRARAVREKFKPQVQALMEKMRPLHEQLRALLEAERVDLGAVKAKLTEISAAQVEMRLLHIQERLEFQTLLTAEQKTKLRALMQEKMERHRERMDRRRQGGDDGDDDDRPRPPRRGSEDRN
jgi:Spy/CpxP family protein refolding chaperone